MKIKNLSLAIALMGGFLESHWRRVTTSVHKACRHKEQHLPVLLKPMTLPPFSTIRLACRA